MGERRCRESGKKMFDERGARAELATVIGRAMRGDRKRRDGHCERGIYECETCGAWHLTSNPWSGNVVNPIGGG